MYREIKVSKWVLLVDLAFTMAALLGALLLDEFILFVVGVISAILLIALTYVYYENMASSKKRALLDLLADTLAALTFFR